MSGTINQLRNRHDYNHIEKKYPYKLQKNREEDKGFKSQKGEERRSDPQIPNRPKKLWKTTGVIRKNQFEVLDQDQNDIDGKQYPPLM